MGEVVHVRPAAALHRNGELAFKFTKIELPASILLGQRPAQSVDGRLAGVLIGREMNQLRIGEDGSTRIAQSNARFLAPALSVIGISRGFNYRADSWSQALRGAYSGSLLKRLLGADSGLDLPAESPDGWFRRSVWAWGFTAWGVPSSRTY